MINRLKTIKTKMMIMLMTLYKLSYQLILAEINWMLSWKEVLVNPRNLQIEEIVDNRWNKLFLPKNWIQSKKKCLIQITWKVTWMAWFLFLKIMLPNSSPKRMISLRRRRSSMKLKIKRSMRLSWKRSHSKGERRVSGLKWLMKLWKWKESRHKV